MQGWGEGLTLKDHIGFLIKEPPVSTMSEWCFKQDYRQKTRESFLLAYL